MQTKTPLKQWGLLGQLTPFERWMVKSNMQRIHADSLNSADVVALLKARGYNRVAAAVQKLAS